MPRTGIDRSSRVCLDESFVEIQYLPVHPEV
jgi:hypothetical protein